MLALLFLCISTCRCILTSYSLSPTFPLYCPVGPYLYKAKRGRGMDRKNRGKDQQGRKKTLGGRLRSERAMGDLYCLEIMRIPQGKERYRRKERG